MTTIDRPQMVRCRLTVGRCSSTVEATIVAPVVPKGAQSTREAEIASAYMKPVISSPPPGTSSGTASIQHGVTTPVEAKIDPKRAARASAEKTVLLADSSKFGRYAKYRVFALEELDLIISDADLNETAAQQIRGLGVDVVRASMKPSGTETDNWQDTAN